MLSFFEQNQLKNLVPFSKLILRVIYLSCSDMTNHCYPFARFLNHCYAPCILSFFFLHAGADDVIMATGLENLSSHMSSLALTEMEWVTSNQGEASTVINHETKHETKHQNIQSTGCDVTLRSEGGVSSLLAKRTTAVQDQLLHFRNFLSQPNTQSSVAGPSCATTTSVHSASAPMLNQTTFCSRLHSNSHATMEPVGDPNVNAQPTIQGKGMQQLNPCLKDTSAMLSNQIAVASQSSTSVLDNQMEVKEHELPKVQQGCMLKESGFAQDPSLVDDRAAQGKRLTADVIDIQTQVPSSKSLSSDIKSEPSKLDKKDKIPSGKGASVPRKRNYDPELFFKVNGKLYQKLGKIGSGGSSEVHKVISEECKIYALKKIKLRGRDYATAYGFCQEIEYLNRLKGKHNIIQLIDYEVLSLNHQLIMSESIPLSRYLRYIMPPFVQLNCFHT